MDEQQLRFDYGIRISALKGAHKSLQSMAPYLDPTTYKQIIQVVVDLINEAKNGLERDLRNLPDLNKMYV